MSRITDYFKPVTKINKTTEEEDQTYLHRVDPTLFDSDSSSEDSDEPPETEQHNEHIEPICAHSSFVMCHKDALLSNCGLTWHKC